MQKPNMSVLSPERLTLIPSPSLSKRISLPFVKIHCLHVQICCNNFTSAMLFYRFLKSQLAYYITLCTTFALCQRINKKASIR